MKLALLIEYDGKEFSGWQIQENGRSVQGEIEGSFQKLFQRRVVVHGAGRTDTGVHASGMVAHVEFDESDEIKLAAMPLPKLLLALNSTTGYDVVIKEIRRVADDFHARHSALSRQYRYAILQERTALMRNLVWAIRRPIDQDAMREVTAMLVGEHDFTSFSKRTNDVDHYRCIVEQALWDFHGTTFALTLRANRFVRGMVRALTGAIIQVGQGDMSVSEFQGLLLSPQEVARAKYLAPAHGLVLEHVRYPDRFELW